MARANGKVILLGEHAVVYGVPAIAVGLSRGATAQATPAERARIRLGTRVAEAGDGSDVIRALEAVTAALACPTCAVDVELELPPGAGLGASAAIGVAVARAMLEASAQPCAVDRVLHAAAAWEGVFHGNASGVDAAAAAIGGCLWFSRTDGVRPLRLGRDLSLVVAIAGRPAETRVMVEAVRALKERRPALVDKTLDGIRSLVSNAALCLEAGDWVGLGKLMDLNQMLLSGLFVSTEAIERACAIAREAGALGAKLTGAGGGGAVVALVDGDPEPVTAALRAEGLNAFPTSVQADTVQP